MCANLKARDPANPLTEGVLAQNPELAKTLPSTSDILPLPTNLPLPLSHPDKNFSRRYTQGLSDLFTNHCFPNTVLILVSHHKGIDEIIRLRHSGLPDSKKLRAQDHIEDPSYCCTIKLNIRKRIVTKEQKFPFEISEY